MTASTTSTRTGVGRKAAMLLLGAMIACLGVFAFSSQAKAAPASMQFESGKLNLGFAFQGAEILPAPAALGADPDADPPVPGTPLPDLWVARNQTVPAQGACLIGVGGPGPGGSCGPNPAAATVSGDLTGSAVTIAANEFQFPIMVVANPLDGSPVPVSIASTGPVTGTFDSNNGDLSLSGAIEARVLVGLASNPLGEYCALPLVGLTLSTADNADFDGSPFVNGFSGGGTLTGTYNIVDDATAVGGADCGTVNSVSKGLGSVQVTSSSDGPVSMELDYGKLNLGFAFQGADILPAPAALGADPDADPPVPGTPLPDLWVARNQTVPAQGACLIGVGGPGPGGSCGPNPAVATISGVRAGDNLTIPANEFQFPIMVVANPLDGSPVPVSIASTGPVTGTYVTDTGDISLSGPIEARVLVGLASNPLGEYCALPLVGLTLSTTGNADFGAAPFTSGFGGQGALTGTYNIVDDATAVGGADCGTVNSVSKGLGSVWVSNGIAEPPVCPENTQGSPPNCVPIPCPENFTGNEPNCVPIKCPAGFRGNKPNCVKLKARISTPKVFGPRAVKRNRLATFRVVVRNTGNTPLIGARMVASARGIRVNTRIGRINPGAARTIRVRIRFRRLGRQRMVIRVARQGAGNKATVKFVRVRR